MAKAPPKLTKKATPPRSSRKSSTTATQKKGRMPKDPYKVESKEPKAFEARERAAMRKGKK
jgi:hypothetical protein